MAFDILSDFNSLFAPLQSNECDEQKLRNSLYPRVLKPKKENQSRVKRKSRFEIIATRV